MTAYRERLVPGTGTVIASLVLAPLALLVLLPITQVGAVIAAIAVPALAITALIAGAPVITIADGELHAGRAHIAVALTGAPEAFRGAGATGARGVELDARAWTVVRGWIDPVIRIPLTDPDDPAPYWLVSTRHPEALVQALDEARMAAASTLE
ncbi:DUF3093 domain-containing protein [Amnibacterium sp.]|uniref:DUF3093 domain-containing protein n=1 Tax=Amnibacterium sp. TaxID=1872496 RepID=UPI002612C65B|nr:DUF3093 domain-containing protein [Amnibacterium sp.]MCU1472768.1 rane protein [Amnibacterium sp.]